MNPGIDLPDTPARNDEAAARAELIRFDREFRASGEPIVNERLRERLRREAGEAIKALEPLRLDCAGVADGERRRWNRRLEQLIEHGGYDPLAYDDAEPEPKLAAVWEACEALAWPELDDMIGLLEELRRALGVAATDGSEKG